MEDRIYTIKSTISDRVLFEFLISTGRTRDIRLKKKCKEKHYHSFLEIMWITEGTGIVETEKKKYDAKEGDIFIFTGYEYHDLIVTSENLDFTVADFAPKFVWSLGNERFDFLFLEPFFNRDENFENKIGDENTTKRVIRLMKEIRSEFEKKQYKYELAVKAKLLNILMYLARNPKNQSNKLGKKNYNIKYIEESMNYIADNVSESLTLEELAKRCNMSCSYYSTLFKKITGMSPGVYIIERRLETALELLETTDYNISQIAVKCGFNDITNFNKIFKKYIKVTPREYKNSINK